MGSIYSSGSSFVRGYGTGYTWVVLSSGFIVGDGSSGTNGGISSLGGVKGVLFSYFSVVLVSGGEMTGGLVGVGVSGGKVTGGFVQDIGNSSHFLPLEEVIFGQAEHRF